MGRRCVFFDRTIGSSKRNISQVSYKCGHTHNNRTCRRCPQSNQKKLEELQKLEQQEQNVVYDGL